MRNPRILRDKKGSLRRRESHKKDFIIIVVLLILLAGALAILPSMLPSGGPAEQKTENISVPIPNITTDNKTNETVEEAVNKTGDAEEEEVLEEIEMPPLPDAKKNESDDEKEYSPLDDFNGLKPIGKDNKIFSLYDMEGETGSVGKVLEKVYGECMIGDDVDLDCAVEEAIWSSEESWVCEWKCLDELDSCEIFKMHLAVAVLRHFVPATEAFVARTNDFRFYILYKNGEDWMSPNMPNMNNRYTVGLYNDKYYAGEITQVVEPRMIDIEPGESFCFNAYSSNTCTCKVEVRNFQVGDCPQLPADLRTICDKPTTKVRVIRGNNKICFKIKENATEGLYTYDFVLTDGLKYIPAGGAFIEKTESTCCLEGTSFKGFIVIED